MSILTRTFVSRPSMVLLATVFLFLSAILIITTIQTQTRVSTGVLAGSAKLKQPQQSTIGRPCRRGSTTAGRPVPIPVLSRLIHPRATPVCTGTDFIFQNVPSRYRSDQETGSGQQRSPGFRIGSYFDVDTPDDCRKP